MSLRNVKRRGYLPAAVLGAAALLFAQGPAYAASAGKNTIGQTAAEYHDGVRGVRAAQPSDSSTIDPGSGVSYKIKSRASRNLCFNVPNGSLYDGANAEIVDWYCAVFNDNDAEKWTFAADGTLRVGKGDFCLASPALYLNYAVLKPCGSTTGQQWRRGMSGIIYNPDRQSCLAVAEIKTGQQLNLQPCDAADTKQAWVFSSYGSNRSALSADKIYGLGGQCMLWDSNTKGGPPQNGDSVYLVPCNDPRIFEPEWTVGADGTLRAWTTDSSGNNKKRTNSCLGVKGGGNKAGTDVTVWECNGAESQQWWMGSDGSLLNPWSGLCLAADQTAQTSVSGATSIKIKDCDQSPSQLWDLPNEAEA